MKLTETHIKELYKFTRQHYVYFYDVQTELVDHLANDIENIWIEKPNLSFEQARDISFKKFGIFGFMDVIESRQKAMNKRYSKILWRFFKEWFTLPKLLTTISIFLSFFFLLKIPFSKYILISGLLILVTYDLIKQTKAKKKHKNKEQQKEKIFLLESMIGDTRQGFSVLVIYQYDFNFLNMLKVPFSSLENHWLLLISSLCYLLSPFILCYWFYDPTKSRRIIRRNLSRI